MPEWPPIEDRWAKFNILFWYTFGTTIWCITDHSSDAVTFSGLHFHISTSFLTYYSTGNLSCSTDSKTNLNGGANSGPFYCFETSFYLESEISAPTIVFFRIFLGQYFYDSVHHDHSCSRKYLTSQLILSRLFIIFWFFWGFLSHSSSHRIGGKNTRNNLF